MAHEPIGGYIGDVDGWLPIHDPLGQHLAERRRDAQAAHTAATHHPEAAQSTDGPDEIAVVGRHGRQTAAVFGDAHRRLLEYGKLVAYAACQPVQHFDVQLEVSNLEARPQLAHVVLARVGLVATEHQPTSLVTQVDVAVNHARDRHLRRDSSDWLGDEQLVTGRHD